MANLKLNTEYKMVLSVESVSEFAELLRDKLNKLPQIAENTIRRVSEIGLIDNYDSTVIIPVTNINNVISGGIRTTDEIDTYREFGTGIVGSENPHPDIMNGWMYDVNQHGEKGWIYPKSDGTYGWTKGIPAQKKFYRAMQRMKDSIQDVLIDEFKK